MSERAVASIVGVVRVLVLAAVLGGVLAMHALTIDHDTAMPNAAPATSMTASMAGPMTAQPEPGGEPQLLPQAGAGHLMAGVCQAILADLLLLALLALARAATRRTQGARLTAKAGRAPLTGRSPPGRSAPATLSRLCVLRI